VLRIAARRPAVALDPGASAVPGQALSGRADDGAAAAPVRTGGLGEPRWGLDRSMSVERGGFGVQRRPHHHLRGRRPVRGNAGVPCLRRLDRPDAVWGTRLPGSARHEDDPLLTCAAVDCRWSR